MSNHLGKLIVAFFVLFSGIETGFAQQKQRAEVAYMQCMYAAYADGGTALQQLLKRYEKHLIQSGTLKNSGKKAYIQLYNDFVKNEDLVALPTKLIEKEFIKLPEYNENAFIQCQLEIFNNTDAYAWDTGNYSTSPFYVVNRGAGAPDEARFLEEVAEADLQLDFYKLQLYTYISRGAELYMGNSTFKSATEHTHKAIDLMVYIKAGKGLYIEDEKVTNAQAKTYLVNYMVKFMAKSQIDITIENEVSVTNYLKFKELLNAAFDEVLAIQAVQLFDAPLTELGEYQQERLYRMLEIVSCNLKISFY